MKKLNQRTSSVRRQSRSSVSKPRTGTSSTTASAKSPKHNYFPSALNVQRRPCFVIGAPGDRETIQKTQRLREAGARVTVLSPDRFSADQIAGSFLVILCVKNQPRLTKKVAAACRQNHALLCAIDQPDYCDVVNVSVFDKGRLRMTIGTGGAAPAVARKIREGLQSSLRAVPLDLFLEDLAALRKKLEHEIRRPLDRIPHLLKAAEGFEFTAHVKFPKNWRKK